MRLSVVIPIHNQYQISAETLRLLFDNTVCPNIQFILVDNGSSENGQKLVDAIKQFNIEWAKIRSRKFSEITILRNEENIGNYPVFEQAFILSKGDFICYFHSDLFIYQKGWDIILYDSFVKDTRISLIGFVGSNEIDNFGGRGLGTMSNFQGRQHQKWKGSTAEVHGKRINGLEYGVVVDGCAMCFRKEALANIGFVKDFPPHHFYDRLMSCQMLEKGYKIGILGIECDHISGQTANQEIGWHLAAEKWCKKAGIDSFEQWMILNKRWLEDTMNPSRGKKPNNWDHLCYLEAERRLLSEYRDKKHLIPVKV